uniref:Secreted protein n=1 Tax=Pyxicephalus adspersus TaxID=30357 RepID=A0AAV3ARD9_PYXAD|nr:TPA: hypothetical protein GDO54_012265 [Pyxicephalus adspersus]
MVTVLLSVVVLGDVMGIIHGCLCWGMVFAFPQSAVQGEWELVVLTRVCTGGGNRSFSQLSVSRDGTRCCALGPPLGGGEYSIFTVSY